MSSILPSKPAMRNSALHPRVRHGPHLVDRAKLKIRNWRVIHACEFARDVLAVVEGQVSVGMRPFIVTPRGAGTAEVYLANKDLEQADPLSLLRAWQDVRNWRKSLLECDLENNADLVHTHSFSSGMAGVRNLSCIVYDLRACIEELAISAGQCERGSWMGRSFRVAEQFIVSRAKAIIVHSQSMKAAVEERGAAPNNIFTIPEPLPVDDSEATQLGNNFLRERFGIGDSTLTFFVPQPISANEGPSPATVAVLEAFALVTIEVPDSWLFVEASPADFVTIRSHADRLEIAEKIVCVEAQEVPAVMQNADVIVATGEVAADPVGARRPNDACLKALSLGKALLAADVHRNRDCSPDGQGCLWFNDGDARDLAYRMVFLATNRDFRATLGASGRTYIVETRSGASVGRQYDAVYRHALAQKRSGPGQTAMKLRPITSAI